MYGRLQKGIALVTYAGSRSTSDHTPSRFPSLRGGTYLLLCRAPVVQINHIFLFESRVLFNTALRILNIFLT